MRPIMHGSSASPRVARSRDELLADKSIDGVLVMSHTAAHHDDVIACAKAGKHVLLDKPIALNVAEAREMVAAAESAGTILMLAYHVRFLPVYQKALALIEAGVIGRPLTMKMSIRCPLKYVTDTPTSNTPGWYVDPALAGGGGFLDHAVHYTDAMRYLLGQRRQAGDGQGRQAHRPRYRARRLWRLHHHHRARTSSSPSRAPGTPPTGTARWRAPRSA